MPTSKGSPLRRKERFGPREDERQHRQDAWAEDGQYPAEIGENEEKHVPVPPAPGFGSPIPDPTTADAAIFDRLSFVTCLSLQRVHAPASAWDQRGEWQVTAKNLIAYAIILIAIVAVVIAIVRSRRRRTPHYERINLIDEDESGR